MPKILINLPDKLLKDIDILAKEFYLDRTSYIKTVLRVEVVKQKNHGQVHIDK